MGARRRAWSAEIAAHEAALGLLHDEERALLDAMERRQASTEAARASRQELEIRLRAVDEDLTQARVRATEMQARAEAAAARREDLERRIATAASEATRLAERLEEAVVRRRGREQERAECGVTERRRERLRRPSASYDPMPPGRWSAGGVAEDALVEARRSAAPQLRRAARNGVATSSELAPAQRRTSAGRALTGTRERGPRD
jgi:chromosome segregation ATPase